MTDPALTLRALRGFALAAALLLPGGCASPTGLVELISYKDPEQSLTYTVRFEQCAFALGPDGDYHIAARALDRSAGQSDRAIVQLLHAHVFWRPRPGKTFANSTTVDATLRYALLTADGAAIYGGTGFVYLHRRPFGRELDVSIESGRLRAQKLVGNPPELLGSVRLRGRLLAAEDPAAAMDIRRQLDLCTERAATE